MAKKKERNYLDFIPVHSDRISYERDESGQVTILIENKGVFNRLFQKIAEKPRITRVDLQGQGNFVWLCIDGKKTVYDIAEEVRARFGEEAEPLYNRLVTYMRTLESCGFVVMKKP
ncbi:MAG: PqqD family protein [Ruminiclostridium sp.]